MNHDIQSPVADYSLEWAATVISINDPGWTGLRDNRGMCRKPVLVKEYNTDTVGSGRQEKGRCVDSRGERGWPENLL